jgi:DNA (cytosine-5)-methyltransferase 1
MSFSTVELCAGGGGQALGLEMAGFHHEAVVEYEPHFCTTLRKNRPHWNTRQEDIREFPGHKFRGIDLLAGGVPCPPFTIAGKQLGAEDARDMFPAALNLVEQIKPRAVLFENVPGLASAKFEQYRRHLLSQLRKLGYETDFRILQAANYGVPQLRPRFILVALQEKDFGFFQWPEPIAPHRTVGETIVHLMGANGWTGAEAWAGRAAAIAPTIVGGSKLHGGPDLGPTRAKQQWLQLGVDALGIADSAPDESFSELMRPRLTLDMVALIQSFPCEWKFAGGKTIAYRQIGNAFPPLVAHAVGLAIRAALNHQKLRNNGRSQSQQLRLLESHSKSNHKENGLLASNNGACATKITYPAPERSRRLAPKSL